MESPPPHSEATGGIHAGLPGSRADCPACGEGVVWSPSETGMLLVCPGCGGEFVPSEVDQEAGIHAPHWATGAGLIISLFLHTLLLCAFMVLTWQRDSEGGREEGIEVGIVSSEETAEIASPRADPIRYEGQWAELSPAIPTGAAEMESLGEPEMSASAQLPGAPVGLELATGGMSGLEGDFAGLGSMGVGSGGSARFFGLVARGRKFVYVVDRSGSMNGQRLEDAKRELIRSINALPRFAEYYVYFFNQNHVAMPVPGLVRATPENKRQYKDWIRGIQAGGGTDPTSALLEAMDLEPDAIWLLSDGEFEVHAATRLKAKNRGQGVQVHTISFHSESGKEILQRIAKENEGRYRFVGGRDGRSAVRTRIHR